MWHDMECGVYTKQGILIASKFMRVVHGRRGDYVEFSEDQIEKSQLQIPKGQEWRLHTEKRFYIEYRTPDGTKVYYQKQYVGYADYKPGFYYISPQDLSIKLPSRQSKLM